MAQTIEDFVGKALDDSRITSTHVKVISRAKAAMRVQSPRRSTVRGRRVQSTTG